MKTCFTLGRFTHRRINASGICSGQRGNVLLYFGGLGGARQVGDSLNIESSVRITCVVGYLCSNFSLPRSRCCRVRSNVRDRHSERRQTALLLNRGRMHIIMLSGPPNMRHSVQSFAINPRYSTPTKIGNYVYF